MWKKIKNLDLAHKSLNADKVGADLFSPYYFLVFPTNLLTPMGQREVIARFCFYYR